MAERIWQPAPPGFHHSEGAIPSTSSYPEESSRILPMIRSDTPNTERENQPKNTKPQWSGATASSSMIQTVLPHSLRAAHGRSMSGPMNRRTYAVDQPWQAKAG